MCRILGVQSGTRRNPDGKQLWGSRLWHGECGVVSYVRAASSGVGDWGTRTSEEAECRDGCSGKDSHEWVDHGLRRIHTGSPQLCPQRRWIYATRITAVRKYSVCSKGSESRQQDPEGQRPGNSFRGRGPEKCVIALNEF